MKLPAALLAGSLAINTALLVALALKPALAPPAFRDFFARGSAAEPTASALTPARTGAPATKAAPAVPATGSAPAVWSKLSTHDLKALIAQLQSAGFPLRLIRTIVLTQLEADFTTRMRELSLPDPNTPFWKSPASLGSDPARIVEYSRLARERTRLVKELFGEFAFRDDGDLTSGERRRYGNIDRAKIDAIERINADYSEMSSQIRAAMGGITLPEDREKMALLEREQRADIAALLSPAEMADYDIRNSTVTMRLRQQLNTFNATEDEFRKIYAANHAVRDVLFPNLTNAPTAARILGPENAAARAAAENQVAEQLRAVLGPQRYAEYERAGDREFQQLSQIALQQDLPASVPVTAYGIRTEASAESNRIANDATMSVEAKRAALRTLAENSRARISSTLGAEAAGAYLRTATNWLTALERGQSVSFTATGTSFRGVTSGSPGPARGAVGGRVGGGVGGSGAPPVLLPGSVPVPPR